MWTDTMIRAVWKIADVEMSMKFVDNFPIMSAFKHILLNLHFLIFLFLAGFQEYVCEFYMESDEIPSALVPLVLDLRFIHNFAAWQFGFVQQFFFELP